MPAVLATMFSPAFFTGAQVTAQPAGCQSERTPFNPGEEEEEEDGHVLLKKLRKRRRMPAVLG